MRFRAGYRRYAPPPMSGAKVTVGFWEDNDGPHWYIVWLPDDKFSSGLREPTEAEVRDAVRFINEGFSSEAPR